MILILLKEVRKWSETWERYHVFVSYVIKGMRKRGEFKISLSHPRGWKILLNSTTSDRKSMGGGEQEKGCFKCGL